MVADLLSFVKSPVEERPAIVNERKRLGDYEIDLIVGPKNKGAILTFADQHWVNHFLCVS